MDVPVPAEIPTETEDPLEKDDPVAAKAGAARLIVNTATSNKEKSFFILTIPFLI